MFGGQSTEEMTNVAHLSPVFFMYCTDVISITKLSVCMWLCAEQN